jgi:hypothetical protein
MPSRTNIRESKKSRSSLIPGNYKDVLKKISPKLISKHEIKGSKLIISTDKPQKLFHELFSTLEECKENILDLKLGKASLDDIFIYLSKTSAKEIEKDKKDFEESKEIEKEEKKEEKEEEEKEEKKEEKKKEKHEKEEKEPSDEDKDKKEDNHKKSSKHHEAKDE